VPAELLLVVATLLMFAALYLYCTLEDETKFPWQDKENDKWYQKYRKGLRK
jgi:hypothetical protein